MNAHHSGKRPNGGLRQRTLITWATHLAVYVAGALTPTTLAHADAAACAKVRSAALQPGGIDALQQTIAARAECADEAARTLVKVAPRAGWQTLTHELAHSHEALFDSHAGTQLRLFARLAAQALGSGQVDGDAFRAWALQVPPAAATYTLRYYAAETTHPPLAQLWLELSARSTEFAAQWYLAAAASSVEPSEAVDDRLATWALGPSPHLAAAAIEALVTRRAAQAPAVVHRAIRARSPRVRATAIAKLGAGPSDLDQVTEALQNDRWAIVRRAALTTLQRAFATNNEPAVVGALQRATRDADETVRTAAIAALRARGIEGVVTPPKAR